MPLVSTGFVRRATAAWACAAAGWAVLFGGLHVAWAAGSRLALVDAAAAEVAFSQPWFQVYNLVVAAGCFAATAAAVVVVRPMRRARRWTRSLLGVIAALLVVRGSIGVVQLVSVSLDATRAVALASWAIDLYMVVGALLFGVLLRRSTGPPGHTMNTRAAADARAERASRDDPSGQGA